MRTILGVSYKHGFTAYIRIGGPDPEVSLRNAKKVGTALKKILPSISLAPPRYRGCDDHYQHLYEIPVIIISCPNEARAAIAEMVLKGSL